MITEMTPSDAQTATRQGLSRAFPAIALENPAARRVTLVATSPSRRGGTERVVYLLAAALRRRGVRAGVLIPTSDDDRDTAEATQAAYVADGIPTRTDSRFSRRHVGFHNIRALRSLWRPGHVGTVNIHYSTTTGASLTDVVAARLAGKRCVLSLHHPVPLNETSSRKRRAISAAVKLADAVVVTTDYTRQLLQDDLPSAPPITVVPLGIPLSRATAGNARAGRAAARAEMRIAEDAFVIGHLARLVRYKGLFQLIEAVAKLKQAPSTAPTAGLPHLLIAGDGPDRHDLEVYARKLLGARVTFLGDIADPDPLYAASDVFAMPSSLEGFGLVYVEAAQHGVPSIATATGGVPYVIRDGESGLLVEQDAVAIAEAIRKLWADPSLLKSMGTQARHDALTRFSDLTMADAYCEVLFPTPLN